MQALADRLRALVDEVRVNIWQFDALGPEEKVAVASVLQRGDLLVQSGVHSLDEARQRLGEEWWTAVLAARTG